jgi:hypothetical protein
MEDPRTNKSPVFRSMIALANTSNQRDPIYLTDPAVEHSEVIEEALDIIYTLNFSNALVGDDPSLVNYVVDFARKWEILMVIDIIRKEMAWDPRGILSSNAHFESFLLAIRMKDNELAAKRYVNSGHNVWLDETDDYKSNYERSREVNCDGSVGKGKRGTDRDLTEHYLSDIPASGLLGDDQLLRSPGDGGVFDLGHIPYVDFLCIPPTVLWIIARAQRSNKNRYEVGQDIHRLLDLACRFMYTTHDVEADLRPSSKAREAD